MRDEYYEKQLKAKTHRPSMSARAVADADPEELDAEVGDDELEADDGDVGEGGEAGEGGEGGEGEWDPDDEDLLPEETPPMEQLPAATVLERAAAMVVRADKFLTHEKFLEAERLLESAAAALLLHKPASDPKVYSTWLKLAYAGQMLGKKDAALELYEKWVPEHRTNAPAGGDRELAVELNNLAELLGLVGRVPEAEAACRDSLAMMKTHFPPESTIVTAAMSNLAGYMAANGRTAEALPLARTALKRFELQLGTRNQPTVDALHCVLKMLHDLGRKDEVEALVFDWRWKLDNPNLNFLTDQDFDRMVPENLHPSDPNLKAAFEQAAVTKPFDPEGFVKDDASYAREWRALWKKLEEKGLSNDPTVQQTILEDLISAGRLRPSARKAATDKNTLQTMAKFVAERISNLPAGDVAELLRLHGAAQAASPDGDIVGAISLTDDDTKAKPKSAATKNQNGATAKAAAGGAKKPKPSKSQPVAPVS